MAGRVCIHKLSIYSCDNCSPLADEPRQQPKPFVPPRQHVNFERKPTQAHDPKQPEMATEEQIREIRRISSLGKKVELNPLTKKDASAVISALRKDGGVYVRRADGKRIALRVVDPWVVGIKPSERKRR